MECAEGAYPLPQHHQISLQIWADLRIDPDLGLGGGNCPQLPTPFGDATAHHMV